MSSRFHSCMLDSRMHTIASLFMGMTMKYENFEYENTLYYNTIIPGMTGMWKITITKIFQLVVQEYTLFLNAHSNFGDNYKINNV